MSEGVPLENESAPTAPEPPKGALAIIFFIVLMDLLGFGIIIPLLAFYVPDFQHNPLKVTALFSVYSICQFIGSPVLGLMSDRFGRRPVLALSQAGSAIGYVLLAIAAFDWHNPATRLTLVYVSRILDGFTGGNIATAQAYVSDVTTPQNRAKGMGMLGAAFGIGFSIGPALGGIAGHWSLSLPGWIAAAFSALAAALTWARLPESRTHRPTEAENWLHPGRFAPILRKPALLQLLVVGFCIMAAFVMMESTLTLFVNRVFGWGELGVGLYFLFVGFVIVCVQGGMIGRLTKKYGDWPPCIVGPFLVALGMIGLIAVAYVDPRLSFGLAMTILLIAGAINACGRSFQQPTLSSLLSKFSDRNEQGVVFGLYHGLSSLARVVGPIVAGFAYPLMRNSGQFLVAAVIAVAMGAWTLGLRRPTPDQGVPEATAEAALERG
ncbi:MAG TPA: MFS transporter [Tepidisphaeraceae bacterium]|jgi:DHA1 family tetracycline resistance protein-like MFS transporter